jgi:hypothetical protein
LIEDKSHGAELPDQQHDLMFIVHQIMEFAPRIFQGFSSMRGDRVPIRYHGLTSIRYSGPSPDGSDWIKVGKKDVDLDQLIKILQFDISHLTLRPIDHRIGHHRRPDLLPFAETGAA